jgi:putative chitinase
MIPVTADQLRRVMPYSTGKIDLFLGPLNASMEQFAINTAKRQAHFISQIAHESSELRFTAELADGHAYEGRVDLGNTQPGDGSRFKGRGILQITGRANYEACGQALGLPLILNPTLLETPGPASRSAGWFWLTHGCNELADLDEFGSITHRINGGYTGIDQRFRYHVAARKALGL